MPPVTQCRQGSTIIGSNPTMEPYPSNGTTMERSSPILRPSTSLCPQFSPSALSSLRLQYDSTPTPYTPMASPAPDDLDLHELGSDAIADLLQAALDVNGDKSTILLLDMRPSVHYAVSSIKTAVSVCVPNMLLKRCTYSLSMLTEQLTTQREVDTFANWRQFSLIVLFDATGTVPVKGSPMCCIAQKFRKEGCAATLGYIQGGFNAFSQVHPSLCCSTDNSPTHGQADAERKSTEAHHQTSAVRQPTGRDSPSRSRLHLGSLPSMTLKPVAGGNSICQTPMIENPNNNPLFESVRQAMGLNTNITEEVPVRLPPRFSVETVRDQVPSWLLDAICDSHGKTKLAEFFQKVEVAEKKRLAILMAPQEMRSGRTVDFSICAGLEKGMKNRYNHVWPFDKTRVKIEGCEDGEDDYINASFLQPPFGNRSYIATQGPLPSTFEDFWKIVWEQGSKVIVMLTREYEAGRIKCHRYWPTSEDPVMELGPLQVTFSSDRRPDPTNDTIVVRQVYLSNLHCPDESRRMITQVQYTGWPDFGVPETPLEVLQVVQLANDHNISASAGPMVVHCSAGCGRTGAFCVIDSILAELKHRPELKLLRERSPSSLSASMSRTASFGKSISNERVLNAMGRYFQAKEESAVSDVVFATVIRFREQRLSMVQCLRQYVFCYEAILWHLTIGAAREQGRTIQIPFKTTGLSTPLKAYPVGTVPSHASLSRGNAPVTTSNEEFSFFG